MEAARTPRLRMRRTILKRLKRQPRDLGKNECEGRCRIKGRGRRSISTNNCPPFRSHLSAQLAPGLITSAFPLTFFVFRPALTFEDKYRLANSPWLRSAGVDSLKIRKPVVWIKPGRMRVPLSAEGILKGKKAAGTVNI